MMKLKKQLTFIFLFVFSMIFAQYEASNVRHFIKIEGGSLLFYKSTLSDTSTELKPGESPAFNVNAIWGWDYNEEKFLGLGAGYTSYEKFSSASLLGEMIFFTSNTHFNPYIGVRAGYDFIFIDNASRKGDMIGEFLTGLQIRFSNYSYFSIYLQSGFAYRQKSLMIPLRFGVRF